MIKNSFENKILLALIYTIVKFISYICRLIYSLNLLSIFLLILISYISKNSIVELFVLFLVVSYPLKYLSIKVNNSLCIDRIKRRINMDPGMDINKLNKSNNELEILNSITYDFINGINDIAKNPKKYHIKNGQTYTFRTHGAIYVLFKRNFKKVSNNHIVYDSETIEKVIRKTKCKQQTLEKLTFQNKLIFLIDRVFTKKSLKEFLETDFSKLEKLQICEFKVIFDSGKNTAYFTI